MRRRHGAIAVSTFCIACGSSPAAPTPPLTLHPGNYVLTLRAVPSSDPRLSTLCLDSTLAVDRASIPVVLAPLGNGWSVRPVEAADLGLSGSLQLFEARATIVQGPLQGSARDPETDVTVSISPLSLPVLSAPPVVSAPVFTGFLTSEGVSGGPATAELQFQKGNETRRCMGAMWELVAQ